MQGGGVEKGSNTMSESDTALHDEEVFSDELPDAVLCGFIFRQRKCVNGRGARSL